MTDGQLIYLACSLITVPMRYLAIWLDWKICAHSDGGGWDAGTSYSYHPRLKRKHSINYDSFPNPCYIKMNWREKLFWSLFCAALGPLTLAIQVTHLVMFSLLQRFWWWVSMGKMDSSMPKEWVNE